MFSVLRSEMHQRSWWEIVIIIVKIANILLHHLHHKLMFYAKLKLGELTNAKVFWPLLKQGVHHFFGLMFFGHRRGRCHLLPLSLLSLRLKKKKALVRHYL